ncbi:hypothetical protein BGZ83_003608 [Gryganskiella cystojenkinii]|nr:hypothetical protein BGZ83_003608 [Gryganskiella cystojenkinii]
MSPPQSSTSHSKAKDYWCIMDGQTTKDIFAVEISPTANVDDLKNAIKKQKADSLSDVDAPNLDLWKQSVLLDATDRETSSTVEGLDRDAQLHPKALLSNLSLDDNTYIIIQRPASASKRDREDDEGGLSSKRSRLDSSALLEAIEVAGLTGKAVVEGDSDLSLLNKKDKVSLLNFMGEKIDRTNAFKSLSATALKLRGVNMEDMDRFSAPSGTTLPVVDTNDLYIRQTYKDLYKTILGDFEKAGPYDPESRNHIVVAGTSGIGKSAFLVFFAIRLLAESDDSNPPLVIFHTKRNDKCYVFGGCSIVRSGKIDNFEPFLSLKDTWYLVDGALGPVLGPAKTIISASSMTATEDARKNKNVEKKVSWLYYMAPWNLEELKTCRNTVTGFQVVPTELIEGLYMEIGGVPRYVLERPMTVLKRDRQNLEGAKDTVREQVDKALNNVRDPMVLIESFQPGQDTSDFSSRLIHHWPVDEEHSKYRLEWASASIRDEISVRLTDNACSEILQRLIGDPKGSASGVIFEAYVVRTFRQGGYTFELNDLQTGESDRLIIPQSPKVSPKVNRLHTFASTEACQFLIPKIRNFACVDLLVAHRDLLQITVSETHTIKGPPFLELTASLTQHHWIDKPEEARLIFVVPSHAYDEFQKQNYLTSVGKVYEREKNVPSNIWPVKQYVLKIDVESAAAGKSPGL